MGRRPSPIVGDPCINCRSANQAKQSKLKLCHKCLANDEIRLKYQSSTIRNGTCANCKTYTHIHARGLCHTCYKRYRDGFKVTRITKQYTAKEREFMRQNWGKLLCEEIAEKLGRKKADVYDAAVRFGIVTQRRINKKMHVSHKDRIRRLHDEGLSDREIALKIGRGKTVVSRFLRREGLPSNCRSRTTDPFPTRTREKMRQVKLDQIEEDGLESVMPCQQKNANGRAEAIAMGWPQAETLFEARVLECFYQHGDSTLSQVVCDVSGRTSWTGHVVRDLKKRGLLEIRCRENRECVYGLAFGLTKVVCSKRILR